MDTSTVSAGSQPIRRNLNHETAARLIAEWQASGQSAKLFAASVGASAQTLLRWRRRLCGASAPSEARLCRVTPTMTARQPAGLVVEARSGVRVVLPVDCSEAQLQLAMRVAATC